MQKQLPGGLILRSLSENHLSDREQLPDFYAGINTEGETEHVQEGMRHWVRDLIYEHPTVTWDDVFVVVDPAKNDLVVSATLLIPQTWRYEDILIPVGRPELVATHPDYRGRGLVRALFEVIHERSAALGHQLQVITGIYHFYRQFGYTLAVEHGTHAVFHLFTLPDLDSDYQPIFTLRPATEADIPAITAWSADFAQERLLTDAYTSAELRYEITGRHPGFYPHTAYQVIMNAAGEGVGYITMLSSPGEVYETRCLAYVVGNQASYLATFADVTQAIKQWAISLRGYCPAMLVFRSGLHETINRLVALSVNGSVRRADDTWYLRVPDPIKFLQRITPVLERRFAGSGARDYTGELRIGFYDLTGICLKFQAGKVIEINPISGKDGYDVSFPWQLFWNVVFGDHRWDELGMILPEVAANQTGGVLLEILFPQKTSWVRGLA